jgi:hypothetical protein
MTEPINAVPGSQRLAGLGWELPAERIEYLAWQ